MAGARPAGSAARRPRRARQGRGRRPRAIAGIGRERMDLLFGLAAQAARERDLPSAHRYVKLAFTIGTRYNIRLRPEQRRCLCRGCFRYLIPGKTARVRVRGRLIVTCMGCGRIQRAGLRPPRVTAGPAGAPAAA